MNELDYDIVIVGMGLGASAIAAHLSAIGARIAMVPGVGCARFKHLDGGTIAPGNLESVFGTSSDAPLHAFGDTHAFRRDLLEAWAVDRVRDSTDIIDDFADLCVVPHASGQLGLQEESGDREIVASLIVLTEGASPKIGIAAKIRTDFEPEDLLHFGRTILPGVEIPVPVAGEWRTSWNMPAWYGAIPHPDGAIVSASARIENLMRVNRDGRDVLADFLQSPIAASMGLPSVADTVGMELVPLAPPAKHVVVGTHRMLIAPDANGTIDPRSLHRFTEVLASGAQLGAHIAERWPHFSDWEDAGVDLAAMFTPRRTPYHDSSETGFIEDGAAGNSRLLRRLLKR